MSAPSAHMMGPPQTMPSNPSPATNSSMPPPNAQAASASPNAAPSNQRPGHPSFRRQRASRACETCHSRKVRCDAASLGVPCTNCVAFSIECKIPAPKRKRNSIAKAKDITKEEDISPVRDASTPQQQQTGSVHEAPSDGNRTDRNGPLTADESFGWQLSSKFETEVTQQYDGTYEEVRKPKLARIPITEAGRVTYIGESSNVNVLVDAGPEEAVHYPLPDGIRGSRARKTELDNLEMDILHQRGAFLLPPRVLCDELVDAYFQWVWPVVPVVNKTAFMRRYRDPKNPPSLLLLQAILLAGTRVCANPQLFDATGSTTPAAMTFYKRAKALYDANYEDDRVTLIQSLILMGWYWEGPEDVTKNVFYWTRVAIIIAQGSGMHRSVELSALSKNDKRLWKRVWWTLFTRDRSVAVALGRPVCINTDDSDVEMLTEEDFVDEEADRSHDLPADPVHIQFFLNYVKLTEIMGIVLSQQYSVATRGRRTNALDLTASDMALADWLQNCPREVTWDKSKHQFWGALLQVNYYTTLCLLHRAHMPPVGQSGSSVHNGFVTEQAYPSRNIAYQASGVITSIVETLQKHDEIRYAPAFIVYSLMSALIMHVYQMRSSNLTIKSTTEQRIRTCMSALDEVSKNWLAARMVQKLFATIIGNKTLEDKLQRAAGNRHKKQMQNVGKIVTQHVRENSTKRKYEDMEEPGLFGTTVGAPTAQMSYERSRPQTPAMTPAREGVPGLSTVTRGNSPEALRHDAFMGVSRTTTRPGSPSHHGISMSYPGTPPDLFLVTRDSPTLPAELWNSFQPDQLFPAEANISIPLFSPQSQASMIDPALSGPPPHQANLQQQHQLNPPYRQPYNQQQPPPPTLNVYPPQQHQQIHPHHQQQQQFSLPQQQQLPQQHMHEANAWSHLQLAAAQASNNNDDAMSVNSNMSQGASLGIVPTTLNVEDWFQFFGIPGEGMGGMGAPSSVGATGGMKGLTGFGGQ